MRKLLAAALLLLSGAAHAQIITINENLATSSNTFYFDTNSPRLTLGATFYSGSIPSVILSSTYNAVIGNCVLYATGTINCLGVQLTTGTILPPGDSTGVVTSAALGGNGQSTNPLFIQSSSVAVLNASGFVQNFQLDSSSVNKKIGISSSCATGSYWDTTTIVNGVQMGGVCLTLPSGPAVFILNSSQTASGDNTFAGVHLTSFTSLGPTAGTSFTGQNGVMGFYMKSLDGVTLSSGCLVVLSVNNMAGSDRTQPFVPVFSSTTSVVNQAMGILLDPGCAPLSICRVGTYGYFIVNADAVVVHDAAQFDSNRCMVNSTAGSGVGTSGYFMTGGGGANAREILFLGKGTF